MSVTINANVTMKHQPLFKSFLIFCAIVQWINVVIYHIKVTLRWAYCLIQHPLTVSNTLPDKTQCWHSYTFWHLTLPLGSGSGKEFLFPCRVSCHVMLSCFPKGLNESFCDLSLTWDKFAIGEMTESTCPRNNTTYANLFSWITVYFRREKE